MKRIGVEHRLVATRGDYETADIARLRPKFRERDRCGVDGASELFARIGRAIHDEHGDARFVEQLTATLGHG